MPLDILSFGYPLQSLRPLIVTWSVAYAASYMTQLPGFIIAFCTWATVVGPLMSTLSSLNGLTPNWSDKFAFAAGLSDTLAALLAGTMTIAPSVWYRLSERPRVLSLGSVLAHLFALLTMLGSFGIASISLSSHGSDWRTVIGENIAVAISGAAILLFLPTAIAYRLANYIAHNSEQFDFMSIVSRIRQGTFSGLSSDYWRRHNSSESLRDDRLKEQLPEETRGIVAIQKNGTISFANRIFSQLTDAKHGEIIGRSIHAVGLKPELSQALIEVVDASLSHGPRSIEKKLGGPNGPRFLQISTQLTADPEFRSLATSAHTAIVIVTDVTERRTIEASLLRAQKLDSLGALASGVAHDFSNTLTTIAGLASVATQDKVPENTKLALESIIKATKEAGATVRNLLDYCSSATLPAETTKLSAAISERLPLIRQVIGEETSLIVTNKELEESIKVDKNLFTQALTNIVLNAKESYGSKPGKVEIETGIEELDETDASLYVGAAPGKYARISVKDYGCGMTSETLHKAFEPLYTTKGGQGHGGLGLSIVYAVVRASDGFLIVESQPDKGTKVSVYLPVAKPATKEKADEEGKTTSQSATSGKERILVVEDDKHVRELVSMMLKTLGYQVTTFEGGEEALRETSIHQFDLVLVDMIMPGMRGTELIRRLKEVKGDLKALIMTGYSPDSEQSSVASNVLNKPFDLETLSSAIRATLKGSRFSAAQFVKNTSVTH
jgi:signal transduction histidine kinase/ActR/RegA family two-component response regulator